MLTFQEMEIEPIKWIFKVETYLSGNKNSVWFRSKTRTIKGEIAKWHPSKEEEASLVSVLQYYEQWGTLNEKNF
jgi:hypothetical protein